MVATIAYCILLYFIFLTCLMWQVESRRIRNIIPKIRIPFLSSSKKEYTPLVFFTFPKGFIDECDEMEKVVSEIEEEIGCRVERLDIARDSAAEATMSLLTRRGAPFLYHRESCQIVHGSSARGTGTSKKTNNDDTNAREKGIDKARVVAWAKGRYLPPIGVKVGPTTAKRSAPIVVSQEDTSLDQAELIKESSLTPEQLEGKRAMEQRTEAHTVATDKK
eukprot:CAMPEP_0170918082 /NCGR_PEP_ID=MMETSP0735-20130129/7763_1 /TAXON_ID=186038 /ORGANISM="Fragilariopsis kerguelensis, Strain L26-C5" /LENGTH=219 /DNA_ID=CAMNT_0011316477 /DNA_START=94 /DNA_END=751 /DNA_ORIENTATION=+